MNCIKIVMPKKKVSPLHHWHVTLSARNRTRNVILYNRSTLFWFAFSSCLWIALYIPAYILSSLVLKWQGIGLFLSIFNPQLSIPRRYISLFQFYQCRIDQPSFAKRSNLTNGSKFFFWCPNIKLSTLIYGHLNWIRGKKSSTLLT